jgi:hypothetical protein
MRTLRYKNSSPPGGYGCPVFFSGEFIEAGDLNQLVFKIRTAYQRNNVPIPDNLRAQVEHYICLHTDASVCQGDYEPGDEQSRILKTADIRRSVSELKKAELKWPLDKFLVPRALAETRAACCARCRLNELGHCTTCRGLAGYVKEAIAGRTTTLDSQLGICSVCSCLIAAKIHVSKEALQAAGRHPGEGEYPAHCWLTTEGVVPHAQVP